MGFALDKVWSFILKYGQNTHEAYTVIACKENQLENILELNTMSMQSVSACTISSAHNPSALLLIHICD